MTTQMTILDRFSASASVCDDFVTLGRKNDLQGTWREEEEEEEKQLGPWVHLLTSLFLCFNGSPVIVFVGFLKKIKSSSLHYFYIASYLGSALTWIVEGMGGGLYNVSREWWYALVIFWSSLAQHISVLCLTNRKHFIFPALQKTFRKQLLTFSMFRQC